MQRLEVRLGTVFLHPLVAHHKVDQGDQHADHAQENATLQPYFAASHGVASMEKKEPMFTDM